MTNRLTIVLLLWGKFIATAKVEVCVWKTQVDMKTLFAKSKLAPWQKIQICNTVDLCKGRATVVPHGLNQSPHREQWVFRSLKMCSHQGRDNHQHMVFHSACKLPVKNTQTVIVFSINFCDTRSFGHNTCSYISAKGKTKLTELTKSTFNFFSTVIFSVCFTGAWGRVFLGSEHCTVCFAWGTCCSGAHVFCLQKD